MRCPDILASDGQSFEFLSFFLILPGITFTEYEKILFLKNLTTDFELFLKGLIRKDDRKKISRCLRMPGAAISP